MIVHLVDGTYELFRHHFAPRPTHLTAAGVDVTATRGVLSSMISLLEEGATHVGIATDHVIESFRNDLLDSYKTSAGIDPALLAQFGLLEDVLAAAGFCVWPMVEFEADDALGSAASVAYTDPRVERVVICTPDKDLGQCVTPDGKVIQFDRRKGTFIDYEGVISKFGVPPPAIPDFLALVGDTADGIPGIPGWGAKSAATVLAHYGTLERIPFDATTWHVSIRSGAKLARALADNFEQALLFRRLTTLETDAPTIRNVDELEWTGPTADLDAVVQAIDGTSHAERIKRLVSKRSPRSR